MARRGARGQTQGRGVPAEEEEGDTNPSSLEMTTRSVQNRRLLLDRHLLRALHTRLESSSQPPEPPCPQRVPPAVQKAAEPPGMRALTSVALRRFLDCLAAPSAPHRFELLTTVHGRRPRVGTWSLCLSGPQLPHGLRESCLGGPVLTSSLFSLCGGTRHRTAMS